MPPRQPSAQDKKQRSHRFFKINSLTQHGNLLQEHFGRNYVYQQSLNNSQIDEWHVALKRQQGLTIQSRSSAMINIKDQPDGYFMFYHNGDVARANEYLFYGKDKIGSGSNLKFMLLPILAQTLHQEDVYDDIVAGTRQFDSLQRDLDDDYNKQHLIAAGLSICNELNFIYPPKDRLLLVFRNVLAKMTFQKIKNLRNFPTVQENMKKPNVLLPPKDEANQNQMKALNYDILKWKHFNHIEKYGFVIEAGQKEQNQEIIAQQCLVDYEKKLEAYASEAYQKIPNFFGKKRR